MPEYQIVTMNEGTGDWSPPVDTFRAGSDEEANAYAEENYPDIDTNPLREWYILNQSGENING
jgi:hypothetical protein